MAVGRATVMITSRRIAEFLRGFEGEGHGLGLTGGPEPKPPFLPVE